MRVTLESMPLALGLMVVTGTAALDDEGARPPVHAAERPAGVEPGKKCGGHTSPAEIENTYWKLIRLGEQAVRVGEREGEPHLVLRSEKHQASGSGGCNRLFGGYRIEGGRIRFSGVATTRMFCSDGMDTEREFLKALEAVETWTISRDQLDFLGESGELLARFEALSPERVK